MPYTTKGTVRLTGSQQKPKATDRIIGIKGKILEEK